MLRVNAGGLFRPRGRARWHWLSTFAPPAGHLPARFRHGLQDLPPAASTAAWYGLRAWIEQSCKLTKRGGWQWQRTRMTHPARAARLWLAVAVATLWLVSVGGVAEDAIASSTVLDVTAVLGAPRRQRRATRLRLISVFRRGWSTILVALLRHEPLPPGRLIPEPWPAPPDPLVGEADHAI